MLPTGFEQPAAALILLTGVLACFAGHRFFRSVLGLYGFVLGAMVASSIVGVSNTTGMLIAALIGGLLGSVVLVFAWFAGVSLVGAGLGVLVTHLVWRQFGTGDPPALVVVSMAVAGAIAALFIQKYVIVVGTAFAGAWTIVLAVMSVWPRQAITRGSSDTEVWILYPTSAPSRWAPFAWLALGLAGAAVQLSQNGRRRR
jgi:hypothetical protein